MPSIQIKTNMAVSAQTADVIKTQLGQAIALLPDKSEEWLMVTLEDECRIWFHGETGRPMAIVEVKIFGTQIDSAASQKMTARVCELFKDQLNIDPKDIYISYLASKDWGWNGVNF